MNTNNKTLFIILFFLIFIIFYNSLKSNKKIIRYRLEETHPDWFYDVNRFPDHHFQIQINNTILNGFKHMKNTKIVFAGLCINIEHNFQNLKKRIEYFGQFFKEWKMVIFENNSTDNTRQLLLNWTTTNKNINLIHCDVSNCNLNTLPARNYGLVSNTRVQKMSTYRNILLHEIRKNYNYYDYTLFFDLDIKGPWSLLGIADSFGQKDKWDCITGFGIVGGKLPFTNPIKIYYDTFAYSDDTFQPIIPYSNNHSLSYLFNTIHYYLRNHFVLLKLHFYHNHNNLIKCNSAFGGLAIYKMNIINDNDINYTPSDGIYKCEHVILSEKMRKKGYHNIYINPKMIILMGQ